MCRGCVRRYLPLAAVGVFLACNRGPVPEQGAAETTSARTLVGRPGLRFDPSTIAKGTTVGVLTVDSIRAQRVFDSTYVGMARFNGEIELSGATMRHPDPDLGQQLTCFEADSSSSARLPRWSADERRSWFCFSNNADAARALGPPSDSVPATIVIDRFTIHRDLTDAVNSARFIRLKSGGAPR